jgi:drug/metabolite transporter (DMT)-like permease
MAGTLATSWGAILVRLAAAPPLGAAFFRMAFASVLLLPAAWLCARRAISARILLMMLLAGACLALHFATWITSLDMTSIGSSVVLVATVPLFGAALSAVFLSERPSGAGLAAIAAAFVGAVLIAWGDYGLGGGHIVGDLLALAGAAFAAAYLLIGRHLRGSVDFIPYLAWVYGSSAVILLVFCLGAGTPLTTYRSASYGWLFLMAIGPSLTGHSLLNLAVRHVRAYVVNTVGLAEPLLATLYAFLIFGERPGAHLYAGGALVAAGLLFLLWDERRRLAPAL